MGTSANTVNANNAMILEGSEKYVKDLLQKLEKTYSSNSSKNLLIKEISDNIRSEETWRFKTATIYKKLNTFIFIQTIVYSQDAKQNAFAVELALHVDSSYKISNLLLITQSLLQEYQFFNKDEKKHTASVVAKKIHLINFFAAISEKMPNEFGTIFFKIAKEDFYLAGQGKFPVKLFAKWLLFQNSLYGKSSAHLPIDGPICDFLQEKANDSFDFLEPLIKELNVGTIAAAISIGAVLANFAQEFSRKIFSQEFPIKVKENQKIKDVFVRLLQDVLLPYKNKNKACPCVISAYIDRIILVLSPKPNVSFWDGKPLPFKREFDALIIELEQWKSEPQPNIPSLSSWQQDGEWSTLATDKKLSNLIGKFWKEENTINDYVATAFEIVLYCQENLPLEEDAVKQDALKKIEIIALQYLSVVLRAPEILGNGVNKDAYEIVNYRRKFNHGYQPYAAPYMDRALVRIYKITFSKILSLREDQIKIDIQKINEIEQSLHIHANNFIDTSAATMADIVGINKFDENKFSELKKKANNILKWEPVSVLDYYLIVLDEIKKSIVKLELLMVENDEGRLERDVIYGNLKKIFRAPGTIRLIECDVRVVAQLQNFIKIKAKINGAEKIYIYLINQLLEKYDIQFSKVDFDICQKELSEFKVPLEDRQWIEKTANLYHSDKLSLTNFQRDETGSLPPIQIFSFQRKLVCLEKTNNGIQIVELKQRSKDFVSHKKSGYALFTVDSEGHFIIASHTQNENDKQKIHHASGASLAQGACEFKVTEGWSHYNGHFRDTPENIERALYLMTGPYQLNVGPFILYAPNQNLLNEFSAIKSHFDANIFELDEAFFDNRNENAISDLNLGEKDLQLVINFLKSNFNRANLIDEVIQQRLNAYKQALNEIKHHITNNNTGNHTQMLIQLAHRHLLGLIDKTPPATNRVSRKTLSNSKKMVLIDAVFEVDVRSDELPLLEERFVSAFSYITKFEKEFKHFGFKKGTVVIDEFIKLISVKTMDQPIKAFLENITVDIKDYYIGVLAVKLDFLNKKFGEVLVSCEKMEFSSVDAFLDLSNELRAFAKRELSKLIMILKVFATNFYGHELLRERIKAIEIVFKDAFADGSVRFNFNLSHLLRLIEGIFAREEFDFRIPLVNAFITSVRNKIKYPVCLLQKPSLLSDDYFILKFKRNFDRKWDQLNSIIKTKSPNFVFDSSGDIWVVADLKKLIENFKAKLSTASQGIYLQQPDVKQCLLELESNPLILTPYADFDAERLRQFIFADIYESDDKQLDEKEKSLLQLLTQKKDCSYINLEKSLEQIVNFDDKAFKTYLNAHSRGDFDIKFKDLTLKPENKEPATESKPESTMPSLN